MPFSKGLGGLWAVVSDALSKDYNSGVLFFFILVRTRHKSREREREIKGEIEEKTERWCVLHVWM